MRGVGANNEDPQNQVEDLNVFKKKKEGRMMQLSKKFALALCITILLLYNIYYSRHTILRALHHLS